MRLPGLLNLNLGVPVLPVRVRLNATSMGPSDLLQTVTDTKDRNSRGEYVRVNVR